jgi:hypothetical protein
MEFEAEHQEVPKEAVVVKSSGAMKKRHRGWHVAAGHCGKPKELHKEIVDPRGILLRLQEGVLLCKGNIVRNKWTRAKAATEMQRVWMHHEGRKGVKDLGGRQPYLKKQDLKKLQQESMGKVNETIRKTTELEIAKRIARSTVGL